MRKGADATGRVASRHESLLGFRGVVSLLTHCQTHCLPRTYTPTHPRTPLTTVRRACCC